MLNSLKRVIRNKLYEKSKAEYERECSLQENSYVKYAKEQEQKRIIELKKYRSKLSVTVKTLTCMDSNFSFDDITSDLVVFIGEHGEAVPYLKEAVTDYFEQNSDCDVAYADEDYHTMSKAFGFFPIMKPCWSPETFLSFNYFGEVFAVRTKSVMNISLLKDEDFSINVYDFLLKLTEKAGKVGHIEEVLFHRICENLDILTAEAELQSKDSTPGSEPKFKEIKNAALRRRGVLGEFVEKDGILFPVYALATAETVSILIPSKDNPDVLKRCIDSVFQFTKQVKFEIIVNDNGSSDENRQRIEEMSKDRFQYMFKPKTFNFSAMINEAAEEAKGTWLLLLNDDMEVLSDDWLNVLLGQAVQEGVGVVGAKLLYPNTTIIQHVGVTNAIDGPVHKLIGMDDSVSYYQGKNRLVYNKCAVTGACLLISKENFVKNGGLDTTLRVAYNDVDLCFSLLERNLRCVIRNDVVLYHHESLSRGHDALSQEKLLRLKEERDYLYHKHQRFYFTDPYEGALNSGGADFALRPEYGIGTKKDKELWAVKSKTSYEKYPAGIYVNIERAEKEELMKTYEGEFYVISGWLLLPESDNLRFRFQMVFIGDNDTYVMNMRKYMHDDISAGFPKATNTRLSGFFAYVTEAELPPGEYKVGIFGRDTCSRQRLFQNTDVILSISK